MMLADLLDQQFGSGKVGLELGPKQGRKNRQIKGEGRRLDPRFERGRVAVD